LNVDFEESRAKSIKGGAMPKLKNMSRGGYIVVGIVAALVLVPTGIAAAAVAYTGIEGTNGATATVNHADVTSAGQLLTTEANPSNFVQTSPSYVDTTSSFTEIATPKSGDALIVTSIHFDVLADPTPGGEDYIWVQEDAGSTCTSPVGTWRYFLNPPTIGGFDLPLSPGLVVAKGDALCGLVADSVTADVSVSGYTVSSTDAPTGAAHQLVTPKHP
jgi:hypothetical protein